jgi:signal transduction histidine kinase/CheY-like chemotaxis protein
MPSPPPLESPLIGLLNGEFRDAALEHSFRLSSVRDWVKQISLISIVGGVFFLAGYWVDYVTLGVNRTSLVLLAVRILFSALAIGMGWRVRRTQDPKTVDKMALTVLLACVAATLFIILQTRVPSLRHALTVFVFTIVFYVFVPTRLWINVLSGGSISLGFLIIVTLVDTTPFPVMTMIILYIVLGNILGWIAALHLQRLRRLQWFNLQAEQKARTQLAREVEERKQAEESLRQLASGVAHNFNNSLMAITSNLQAAQGVLRQGGELAAAQDYLNNAWQSAASGREVAQRLTRAVVGDAKPPVSGGLVDISELIQQAQSIARLTWARKDQPLEYQAEMDSGLWVRANRGELIEVFLNLFKNCLEAMTSGGIIQVTAFRRDQTIKIEVKDNGPGISMDIQKRLFKPFTSDKGVRGQGLGLAVSRGILQSLGGSITCQSEPGKGTAIVIELPATTDSPPSHPEAQPAAAQPQGEGKRVLLVEDEGLVALGLSAILRQEGYQVWQAPDLAQAETRIAEACPELVICDFGLPDGNADDMRQIVQSWSGISGSPEPAFIVLTGWSETQLMGDPALLSLQAFAWLQKPVDKQELLDVMREALSNREKAFSPSLDPPGH